MNSLTSASVCPPWRHTVTGAHSERKRTRGFAPSTPASVFLLLALKRSRAVQKEEREREKRLSRNSSVKQYRVPLKTSDKKAHMIPELQSPIPSAKAASAFLSVWMLQQHGGEKRFRIRQKKKKTGEMWQSNGHFHGEGETGAKGVILGLLWASKRWIKMVGYRAELHFCLFFSLSPSLSVPSWSLANLSYLAGRSNLPHLRVVAIPYSWLSHACFVLCIVCGEVCNLPTWHKLRGLVVAVWGVDRSRPPLKECDGYNSHIDAEKELNSFISDASAKHSGRDWCEWKCHLSLPSPSEPDSRCRTS